MGLLIYLTEESVLLGMWVAALFKFIRTAVWVAPPQDGDREASKEYIKEEQARTSTLNSCDSTNIDPEDWPVACAINNTGHECSFSVK